MGTTLNRYRDKYTSLSWHYTDRNSRCSRPGYIQLYSAPREAFDPILERVGKQVALLISLALTTEFAKALVRRKDSSSMSRLRY